MSVHGMAGAPPARAVVLTVQQLTASGAGASLLPQGQGLSSEGLGDAMSALYLVLSQSRSANINVAQSRVEEEQSAKEKEFADEKAALEREEADQASQGQGFFASIGRLFSDAAKDIAQGHIDSAVSDAIDDAKTALASPAFWHDLENAAMMVAKVALTVGSVVATAVTLGAASPAIVAAALALSAGGIAVSETRCLGDASAYVGLGMELAGSALSLGASLATSAGTGMETIAKIGATSTAVGGGAEVVGAAAHVKNGEFAAKAQEAAADAEQAKTRMDRLDSLVRDIIDDIKSSDASRSRAQQTLASAIQTNDTTAIEAVPEA